MSIKALVLQPFNKLSLISCPHEVFDALPQNTTFDIRVQPSLLQMGCCSLCSMCAKVTAQVTQSQNLSSV